MATRPAEHSGLGMSVPDAAAELARLKNMFVLLPDTASIYQVWEDLVSQHQVSGKPAHDARLVAAMKVHGITAILTFDKTGFPRFPGIEVDTPPTSLPRREAQIREREASFESDDTSPSRSPYFGVQRFPSARGGFRVRYALLERDT